MESTPVLDEILSRGKIGVDLGQKQVQNNPLVQEAKGRLYEKAKLGPLSRVDIERELTSLRVHPSELDSRRFEIVVFLRSNCGKQVEAALRVS